MKFWHVFLVAFSLSACAPDENAGGGGGMAPLAPVTVSMVPHMVDGQGHVTFTPRGDEVEVRVHAEQLPPPQTYTLYLIGPSVWRGAHEEVHQLAEVPVEKGRADFALTLTKEELAQWKGIGLMHLPSGTAVNLQQAHPALVASLPRRTERQ